jgi:hypothetical protein
MMKRVICSILCVLLSLALGGLMAGAAQPSRSYLPIVATGAPAATTLTTLVDHDTGFVSAALLPDGRIVLAYQDRVDKGHVHIVWDQGDHVAEVTDPQITRFVLGTAAAAPAFDYPGPKQGPSALLVAHGMLHIYAPARDEGDSSGPFKLKRLSIPLSELR